MVFKTRSKINSEKHRGLVKRLTGSLKGVTKDDSAKCN